jgi:hypothetical protein
MSSHPVADLADSLAEVACSLQGLIKENLRPSAGSPAAQDAVNRDLDGDWGTRPGREVLTAMQLTAWSAADHLAVAAGVLSTRNGVAPLFTLMRGAAESSAVACYLSGKGIGFRERVRRYMNHRLDGLCEEIYMIRAFEGEDARARVAELETEMESVRYGAVQHGFEFHPQKGPRSAYVGAEQPSSAMTLIDRCTSRTPLLGATYHRLLSGVAHAKRHGLTRFLAPVGPPDADGSTPQALNTSAGDLARDLMAGPMCAATLVEHLGWYPRWDVDAVSSQVVRMLHAWGRIAGTPYPGPDLQQARDRS